MSRTPWMSVVKNGIGSFLRSEPELNRREFIALTTRVVGLGILTTQTFPLQQAISWASSNTIVTVIGGGVAGLTAAYRLAQNGVSVQVFEAQSRLGGRIYTQNQINGEGQFIELGGEFIDSDHKDILDLARELKLDTDDFRKDDPSIKPITLFFHGKVFSENDFVSGAKPLFRKMVSDYVAMQSDKTLFEKLNHTALDEYIDQTDGVSSWIKTFLKTAYKGEYGIPVAEQSALSIVTLLGASSPEGSPFGVSDEAMRIKGGNSQLIFALERKCRTLGVKFYLGEKLSKIEFANGSLKLDFGSGTHHSNTVVLALPLPILKNISGLCTLPLSSSVHRSIQELGMGKNSKSMMEFSSKIWRDTHHLNGNLFSDQSIECMWDTSRLQKGRTGILTHFLTAETPPDAKQIPEQLHAIDPAIPGLTKVYTKRLAAFSWPTSTYSLGSYSCPKKGQWSTHVGVFSDPECEGKLFFAGEHCSKDYMGYMNGAVESGNQVASLISQTVFRQNRFSSSF